MPLMQGDTNPIIGSNIAELRRSGRDEKQAIAIAMSTAGKPKHQNLGKFLHPRKDGKPHGTPKV